MALNSWLPYIMFKHMVSSFPPRLLSIPEKQTFPLRVPLNEVQRMHGFVPVAMYCAKRPCRRRATGSMSKVFSQASAVSNFLQPEA
ncbi:hypothetical protein KC329_g70 [Hortaea werneckii]|nr:hypothetical protein KC329_g70 [Hortaea werneckii]